MIMLHILWIVLKIIGILLLVFLGILLLTVCAVLFCPVVYQAEGKRDAHALEAKAGVSWLFHLISLKVWYENQKVDYSVRIFGISLKKALEFFSRRQEKKEKRAKKKEENKTEEKAELTVTEIKAKLQKEIPDNSKEKSVGKSVKEVSKKESAAKINIPKPFTVIKKIMTIPGKIVKAVKNFRLTVKEICGKIEKVKEILKSEQFIKGKLLTFKEIKRLFRHIMPRKMGGYIRFGTEDPCVTGEILAAAGIFYPLYGEHFIIEPYFDQKILEGNLFIRGRIQGIFFLILAWKLFWDSNIRYIVKKFKQL